MLQFKQVDRSVFTANHITNIVKMPRGIYSSKRLDFGPRHNLKQY